MIRDPRTRTVGCEPPTEAVLAIAQRIKFRVSSVLKMPREKKARHLLNLPVPSEVVAARLLVVYHLQQQRPMMAAFLDAIGVKHEDGLIADEELTAPGSPASGLVAAPPSDEM